MPDLSICHNFCVNFGALNTLIAADSAGQLCACNSKQTVSVNQLIGYSDPSTTWLDLSSLRQ